MSRWERVWEQPEGSVVAEIATGQYGGTIRIGEPYADAPDPEWQDEDDTLANVTYWTFSDVRSLYQKLETILPWQE